MGQSFKKIAGKNSMWLLLLAMIVIMSFASHAFFTGTNAINLLMTESIKGILTMGVMFAILTAGIDLSTGAVVALSSVVSASLAQELTYSARLYPNLGEIPVPVAMLAGVLVGTIIGVINGLLVAYTNIHPFIATLGTQLIARALSNIYTNAYPVPMLNKDFKNVGQGKILGIPHLILIFVLIALIAWFMLSQTRFGKSVYAIGGNRTAAEVAGIKVKKIYVWVYTWCSFCAALGGVLLASRSGSGISTLGVGYELDAIAAATIGGVSQRGGIGRVSGAICGILILGVINNGLLLLGISPYIQQVVKGAIIIGAVVFDMRKNAKKS